MSRCARAPSPASASSMPPACGPRLWVSAENTANGRSLAASSMLVTAGTLSGPSTTGVLKPEAPQPQP
jgi:hypothetical protein